MIFNSLIFFVFLLCFLLLWEVCKKYTQLRLYLIFIASCVFYGWWDWRFLLLIFCTGGIDFCMALCLEKANRIQNTRAKNFVRKFCLTLSLISGIGCLSVFKYSKFFAQILTVGLEHIGLNISLVNHIPEFCLILPVGISFYTFQSLSYTIDVYRGVLQPTRNPIHYAAYLMLFPQLVAGPIVRAVDLLPKLLMAPQVSNTIRYNAVKLIVTGFFKKCVVADRAAHLVDTVFSNTHLYTGSITWFVVMLLFSIQIYCDFSGYSDIARGLIRYMGYSFPVNFNHPYIACGMHDFWSRWHISLSTWFRDYLYIPLGGNKKGKMRTYGNLFVTFLISGLWHGAAWNFIIWGAYHAVIQIIERIFDLKKYFTTKYRVFAGIVITWILVLSGWVFFRASSLQEALYVLHRMYSFSNESAEFKISKVLGVIMIFMILEAFLITKADQKLLKKFKFYRFLEPFVLGIFIIVIILFRGDEHGFIYFQF